MKDVGVRNFLADYSFTLFSFCVPMFLFVSNCKPRQPCSAVEVFRRHCIPNVASPSYVAVKLAVRFNNAKRPPGTGLEIFLRHTCLRSVRQ
jgi:hypothetical protein